MTPKFIELVGVLACTSFAGAAFYVTAVEHPARMSCGTEIAAAEWAPSYKRATVMQASLAVAAGLCGLLRGALGGGSIWIWASILIISVIPFTLVAIRPTNNRLLDRPRDLPLEDTRRLLMLWGRLHVVRTALSVVASILFVWAASH